MLHLRKQDSAMRRDAKMRAIVAALNSLGIDPGEVIKTHRGDAMSVSLAFARQLEYVDTTFFDFEFPDLRARDLIPLDSSVPSWAQTFSYRERTKLGEADVVHDYASDFPRVDLDLGETTAAPVISLGCSFGYSVMDLRYAAELGISLDTDKMQAAKEAQERKLDALACYGHAATGLRGFASNSQITTLSTSLNAALNKDWTNATAAQIAGDIDMILDDASNASDGKHRLDTIALPTSTFNLLGSKRFASLDSNGVELSVLDYFENRKRNKVTFEPWFRLKTAAGGTGTRLVAYKKDPSVVKLVVPQDFESMPPEREKMTFVVLCHMRFGGVDWRQPMAARYVDNVETAP